LVERAIDLFRGKISIDIPLKERLGFRRWLKPLQAHAGQRVLNFSFALYARTVKGDYGHVESSLNLSLSYHLQRPIQALLPIEIREKTLSGDIGKLNSGDGTPRIRRSSRRPFTV
jgi:hypothetical protein